jgi:hypothetical protein
MADPAAILATRRPQRPLRSCLRAPGSGAWGERPRSPHGSCFREERKRGSSDTPEAAQAEASAAQTRGRGTHSECRARRNKESRSACCRSPASCCRGRPGRRPHRPRCPRWAGRFARRTCTRRGRPIAPGIRHFDRFVAMSVDCPFGFPCVRPTHPAPPRRLAQGTGGSVMQSLCQVRSNSRLVAGGQERGVAEQRQV